MTEPTDLNPEEQPENPNETPKPELNQSMDFSAIKHPVRDSEGVSKVNPLRIFSELLDKTDLTEIRKRLINKLNDPESDDKTKKESSILLGWLEDTAFGRFGDATFNERNNAFLEDQIQSRVDYKGRSIGIGSVLPVSTIDDGGLLTGKAAISRITATTGTADVVKIPLWDSKIAIQLGGIKESDMHSIVYLLNSTATELGKNTIGAFCSTDDVTTISCIIEFLLDHIIATTLASRKKADLLKVIKTSDILDIMAGALDSVFPKGYPVIKTCVHTLDEGNPCDFDIDLDEMGDEYKYNGLVKFSDMVFPDPKKIVEKDYEFIMAEYGSKSVDEVLAYQKECEKPKEVGPIPVNDTNLYFTFTNPSLQTYFDTANNWISEINTLTNKILNQSDFEDDEVRENAKIFQTNGFIRTLRMRKNAHWISTVRYENQTKGVNFTVSGLDAIYETLDQLQEQDDKTSALEYQKQLRTYKSNVSATLVGLVNWTCPKCKRKQIEATETEKAPTFIPINLVSYFFIIAVLKVQSKEMQNVD